MRTMEFCGQALNPQRAHQSLEWQTTQWGNGALSPNPLQDPVTAVRVASAALPMLTGDPGNSRQTAFNMGPLGTTPVTFGEAVGSRDRNDFYQFTVTQSTDLRLGLSGLSANADLHLLDARGSVLNRSAQGGIVAETIQRTLSPGTYFVRVFTNTSTANTNYTLTLAPTINGGSGQSTPPPVTPNPDLAFINRVLELTNQFRAQNGLAGLSLNAELNATALGHSRDMALQDYFSHTGKNGSLPWDRARAVGYDANAMGENIAAGYTTAESVVQGWINSPGHRANLLNPSFTELGVGYYYLANDTGTTNFNTYWTQMFGSGDTNPATTLPSA
jgi:uncharacterized protein YkwD